MVELFDITEEDFIKYKGIFKRAHMLFGWSGNDAKKVVKDGKESILFVYPPIYMFFNIVNDKIDFKTCVVDDLGNVVSITLDDYQVNVGQNSIYVIDENDKHQSLNVYHNNEKKYFDVTSNGLITYMQYDSKKDIRLVFKYDYEVYGENGKIYSNYLKNPFCVSIETNPKASDKGLFFLSNKDVYYRMDFDVYNKWLYNLATIREYGIGAIIANDTVVLHQGNKEFSRYYKQLFSIGDYRSITSYPFGKPYTDSDIELLVDELYFNKSIPEFICTLFNNRESLVLDFQLIIDEYYKDNPVKCLKK